MKYGDHTQNVFSSISECIVLHHTVVVRLWPHGEYMHEAIISTGGDTYGLAV